MKKSLFLCILPIFRTAIAAEPLTTCPNGYIQAEEKDTIIAPWSCPTGYLSGGTVTSCLTTAPDGFCIMYAPANTEYTDTTGTYEFTEICPLE